MANGVQFGFTLLFFTGIGNVGPGRLLTDASFVADIASANRAIASSIRNIAPILREHARFLREHARILTHHARTLTHHARFLSQHARILTHHARTLAHHARTLTHHARILSNHAPIPVRVAPTLVRGALIPLRVALSIVQVACFHADDTYFTVTSGNFDGGTRMPHVSLSASPLLDDNTYLVIAQCKFFGAPWPDGDLTQVGMQKLGV